MMSTLYPPLLLSDVLMPRSQDELAAMVRGAVAERTALYPIGGGTSLGYGLPPKQTGRGIELTRLDQVIDFPARDLTVTVEAGITMQRLADVLAQEKLRLPLDVPHPQQATLGGVIATGWCGPRRCGHGVVRDFVIGIRAVDGQGEVFNGGGRVVKNVAGYDFCKLLTGSCGTLGIVTQVTLKLRPAAETSVLAMVDCESWEQADNALKVLAESDLAPSAVELFCGSLCDQGPLSSASPAECSKPRLAVLLEGTAAEVAWQHGHLTRDLAAATQLRQWTTLADVSTGMRTLGDFAALSAPLSLKASVVPSRVVAMMKAILAIDPQASLQAHAQNGIVIAHLSEFPRDGLSRTLVGTLQPLAASSQGSITVLAQPSGQEATPQAYFGALGPQWAVMQAVKSQFDPHGILNPGRFVV